MIRRIVFCALLHPLLCAVADVTAPGADGLQVGKQAPPLAVSQWLMGEPVRTFESGRIYVVEFGATWCPPCRKAIRELSALARRHSETVSVVGVFALEQTSSPDPDGVQRADKVRALIRTMGERMQFNVAMDMPAGTTASEWGVSRSPATFVVDRAGRIAWKGHAKDLEPVIDRMLSGAFDADWEAAGQRLLQEDIARVLRLKQQREYVAARRLIGQLIETYPGDKQLYITKYDVLASHDDAAAAAWLKWLLSAGPDGLNWDVLLSYTYSVPKHPDFDLALAAADRAIERSVSPLDVAYRLAQKADILIERLGRNAQAQGDADRAADLFRQAIELARRLEEPKAVQYFEDRLRLISPPDLNAESSPRTLQPLSNPRDRIQ